ncbi:MAG: hypothetical protein ACPL4H_09495, partial [Anaerolineales bacterium]
MAKYTMYGRNLPPPPRPWNIHPIWRGIGCIMMLIIPIVSYAGAALLVEANLRAGWLPLPAELMGSVYIPYFTSIPHLFANLLVTVVLVFIGYGALMILYALIYRLVGPPP